MKYCGYCGNPMEDDAVFCVHCGAKASNIQKQGNSDQIIQNVTKTARGFTKERIVGICATVIAVIVVILVVNSVMGGFGYKRAIKRYVKAYQNCNGEKLLDLTYKGKMSSYYGTADESLLAEEISETVEDYKDYYETKVGSNVKYSYKITNVQEVTDYDEDDISYILNVSDPDILGITKTYSISMELKVRGNSSTNTYSIGDSDFYVVKIGNSWKVIVPSWGYLSLM